MTEGPMLMLYECPNLRATTWGAKLNLPPMKALPRTGLRRRARSGSSACSTSSPRSSTSTRSSCGAAITPTASPAAAGRTRERTCSSATAAPSRTGSAGTRCAALDRHREARRRDGVADLVRRRRPTELYAWIRVGSDGRATVVTAMQDIGTGTKTTMAMIAAEELGIPVEHVTVALGDSARGPYATLSAGSSTTPSMGPAVRAAAADAARQIIEIAAQRYDKKDVSSGRNVSRRRGLVATELLSAARRRADPRQGLARPEPDRDAGAHLRRAGRRGRGRRRDRRGTGSTGSPRSTTSAA